MRSPQDIDANHPIEIAPRIWWVGHYLENDPFQCHVYLIEHGDQSVLIDPGSVITFRHTLRKIEQVTPLCNIRYFVCQHQDPDIAAAMPLVDQLIDRDDAVLVTHGRAVALLKHYDLRMPFWQIEDHDWVLDLGGRLLRFVFTPYAHFPGAFCTFDSQEGVLFSSDLFGGFTEGFQLYARDEGYFESMRPFHEHYMPTRDILAHAVSRLEELPIRMIAPQHGSIIPRHLVRFMIEKLKVLDCGLYLLAQEDTNVQRLSKLNRVLRDITQAMVIYRDFKDIAQALLNIAQRLLPVSSFEFYARVQGGEVLHLAPETRYRGVLVVPPPSLKAVFGMDYKTWTERYGCCHQSACYRMVDAAAEALGFEGPALMIPLFAPSEGTIQAVAIARLTQEVETGEDVNQMIEQMSVPLQVAVERETIYRMLDLQRQEFYERSVRDPLTGLFTRLYMQDTMRRMMSLHDRDANAQVALALFDVDRFKRINDTYGHNQGDEVLRRVAGVIQDNIREGDLPVRLGGEEFAVFIAGQAVAGIHEMAERIRLKVAEERFGGELDGVTVTVSAGIAVRRQQESLTDLIQRADMALYEAKKAGRNRVCVAP